MTEKTTIQLPSEAEVDELFRQHGGNFHGPHVETATITEADFYRFTQALILRTSTAVYDAIVKGGKR